MTKTFRCEGFRNVQADNAQEAAEVFANRLARKEFGKTGYARTLNLNSWTEDRKCFTYNSFIGYSTGRNETTGRNEWLYVSVVE